MMQQLVAALNSQEIPNVASMLEVFNRDLVSPGPAEHYALYNSHMLGSAFSPFSPSPPFPICLQVAKSVRHYRAALDTLTLPLDEAQLQLREGEAKVGIWPKYPP